MESDLWQMFFISLMALKMYNTYVTLKLVLYLWHIPLRQYHGKCSKYLSLIWVGKLLINQDISWLSWNVYFLWLDQFPLNYSKYEFHWIPNSTELSLVRLAPGLWCLIWHFMDHWELCHCLLAGCGWHWLYICIYCIHNPESVANMTLDQHMLWQPILISESGFIMNSPC